MTETSAAPLNGWASRLAIPIVRFHSLAGLLLLAAAIRLPLAFWPNVLHPDEIFQCLEPAWRMLGHDGIVSWEWRYGMRGWLLPSLMAGPVGLGDWVAPGGTGAFVVPRLVAALASLSIVASAWCFGARVSRTHAIIAALVAAIWFELVSFAPHTLSEPLATAVILPAALLLTHASLSQRHLAVGGALLALALVFRFQYAPAIAVLALGACWRRWRNLIPLVAGAFIALILGGVADAAHGAVPFAWLIANVQQNLLHDRAAEFGVTPAITYLYSFWMMWSVALVLLLFAIWQGWRHAPLLFATAVANIAVHSLIGHKEYRFIFLSVALFIIIAALGSADWIQWLRANRAWRRWALPVVAGGWALISGALAATGTMPDNWMRGTGAAQLAAELRGDPALCGLALYNTPFHLLPGRDRLVGRSPLYALHPADPVASGDLAAVAKKAAPAFNRILSRRDSATELPAGFSQRDCASVGGADVCIFARSGGCEAATAAPFVLNDVLVRVDR
ncbi:MAG TPA: 4-amino-4-deoxy-L-arabinose transferase [Bradyrhizobium sp.]|nr:4-amino-4-deoxy-L-arabinose transferase [Bradyrhizobium sp.]